MALHLNSIFLSTKKTSDLTFLQLWILGPSSGLMNPAPAPSHAAGQHRGTQALSSGRVQHDPSVGPAPVRYVNFLACGGYTVEIIGGKHFKTPEGEFVELKSGTQYKIHVKNTHAYGKK